MVYIAQRAVFSNLAICLSVCQEEYRMGMRLTC